LLRGSAGHVEVKNPKIILTTDSTPQIIISLPLNTLCKLWK